MKSELAFTIKLGFNKTTYDPLKLICLGYHYAAKDYKYEWTFRYSDLKKVEAITGETIELPVIREKFNKEKGAIQDWKGDDQIEIEEEDTIYQVIEHQKKVDVAGNEKIATIRHEIPKSLVDTIWKQIIVKQPLNKAIRSRTVAENICTILMLRRFFRDESNTFDFSKFFGERMDYKVYFYYPMKVLAWQGRIKHHKSGKVERLI